MALPAEYLVGDGSDGKRIQLMLLYEEGDPAPLQATIDEVRGFGEAISEFVDLSAQKTGGRRAPRWVTTGSDIVVTVDSYPLATLQSISGMGSALLADGYLSPTRDVLAYVEDNFFHLGGAAPGYQDDDTPGDGNVHNDGSGFAFVGRRVWNENAGFHELAHLLGAAQDSAPHADGSGHVTDGYDTIMANSGATTTDCPSILPSVERWDCGEDDYFHTNPEAGSYLGTHWNIADSHFLFTPEFTPVENPTLWTPDLLGAPLMAWFDGPAIIGLNDADPVPQWDDMSGNARHATQATGTAQPSYRVAVQNGLPIVRFDGNSDFMGVPALGFTAHPFVMAFVATNNGGARRFWSSKGNLVYGQKRTGGVAFGMFAGAEVTYASPNNDFNVHVTTFDTATSFGSLNGTASSTFNIGSSSIHATGINLGASGTPGNFLIGDIGEFMAIQGDLTTEDRQILEGYLAHKWGIALAAGHPFEDGPPDENGDPILPESSGGPRWFMMNAWDL